MTETLFESYFSIRRASLALSDRYETSKSSDSFWEEIRDFISRCTRSGIVFGEPLERRAVQAVINLWATALAQDAPPKLPRPSVAETNLADYEQAALAKTSAPSSYPFGFVTDAACGRSAAPASFDPDTLLKWLTGEGYNQEYPDLSEAVIADDAVVRFEGDLLLNLLRRLDDDKSSLGLLDACLYELYRYSRAGNKVLKPEGVGTIIDPLRFAAEIGEAVYESTRRQSRSGLRELLVALGRSIDRVRFESSPDAGFLTERELAKLAGTEIAEPLQSLVERHLVICSVNATGEPTYKLAHPAIFQMWTRFLEWRRVARDAARKARRRRGWFWLSGVGALAVILGTVATFYFQQWNEKRADEQAERVLSGVGSTQNAAELVKLVKMALEAFDIADTPKTLSALFSVAYELAGGSAHPEPPPQTLTAPTKESGKWTIKTPQGDVTLKSVPPEATIHIAAMIPDRLLIVFRDSNNAFGIVVRDLASSGRERLFSPDKCLESQSRPDWAKPLEIDWPALRVASDGSVITYWCPETRATLLWWLGQREPEYDELGAKGDLLLSPSDGRVALLSNSGTLEIRKKGEKPKTFWHPSLRVSRATAVAFPVDDERIAVADGNAVKVFERQSSWMPWVKSRNLEVTLEFKVPSGVRSLAFTDDAQCLSVTSMSGASDLIPVGKDAIRRAAEFLRASRKENPCTVK